MSEPVYESSTEDAYSRLPMCQREEDPLSRPAYALKTFMSAIFDRLAEVVDLAADLDYYTPDELPATGEDTSALADAALADPAWLPWIGQLLGVEVDTALTVEQQRFQVSTAASGFRAGTKGGLADAVRVILSGDKYVEVFDHQTDMLDFSLYGPTSYPPDPDGPAVPEVESGTQWDVLVRTKASETPTTTNEEAVLAAAAVAKPAGVTLHYREWSVGWAQIESELPTWGDWDGKTWTEIQEAGDG